MMGHKACFLSGTVGLEGKAQGSFADTHPASHWQGLACLRRLKSPRD